MTTTIVYIHTTTTQIWHSTNPVSFNWLRHRAYHHRDSSKIHNVPHNKNYSDLKSVKDLITQVNVCNNEREYTKRLHISGCGCVRCRTMWALLQCRCIIYATQEADENWHRVWNRKSVQITAQATRQQGNNPHTASRPTTNIHTHTHTSNRSLLTVTKAIVESFSVWLLYYM